MARAAGACRGDLGEQHCISFCVLRSGPADRRCGDVRAGIGRTPVSWRSPDRATRSVDIRNNDAAVHGGDLEREGFADPYEPGSRDRGVVGGIFALCRLATFPWIRIHCAQKFHFRAWQAQSGLGRYGTGYHGERFGRLRVDVR